MQQGRHVRLAVAVGSAVLAGGVIAIGLVPAADADDTVVAATVAADAQPAISRGLIVKPADGTPKADLAKAADDALPGDTRTTSTSSLGGGVVVVNFDQSVATSTAAKVADKVEASPSVEWAVPNQVRWPTSVTTSQTAETASDPDFSAQYNIVATEAYSTKAGYLWPATHGRSVVVAVVDTGILPHHPDLAGRIVPGYDFVSNSARSGDGNGRDSDPTDSGDWGYFNSDYTDCQPTKDGTYDNLEPSDWHGTHVAGIVAATFNNGIGVSGVAPGARIEPVRVIGNCGGTDADIIAGIEWAAGVHIAGVPTNKNPAKIINLSLSGVRMNEYGDACSATYQYGYGYAAKLVAKKGALLVAAAGNDRLPGANDIDDPDYQYSYDAGDEAPGGCSAYFTVAATGRTGHAATYSDQGSVVDISAPGGDSLIDGTNTILSTVGINATDGKHLASTNSYGYAAYEGTSMATPEVSAAAAMLYSLGIHTPSGLASALRKSVQPFPTEDWSAKAVAYNDPTSGKTYNLTMDLNCSTSTCGSGILDLARVPAPRSAVTLNGLSSGAVRAKVKLSVNSVWTGSSRTTKAVRWYVSGKLVATASTYTVPTSAKGKTIQAKVAPSSGVFAPIVASSATYRVK